MIIEGILKANNRKLNLAMTLKTGQNFRWKQFSKDNTKWLGILNNLYVVFLVQHDQEIEYKILNSDYVSNFLKMPIEEHSMKKFQRNFENLLEHYFSLDIDLDHLYKYWTNCDQNFGQFSSKFQGIRLLRQDVVENIFSFICSSNNNISRISKMVETLCVKYGVKLFCSSENNQFNDVYSFPSIETLAKDHIEQDLRNFGFGYRAKFINKAAKHIMIKSKGNSDEWIKKLKKLSYEDARQELISLPGVGVKVADCICLMSLGFTESIPIDTHVYKLTVRLYMPELKSSKTLTTKRYNEIGNFYRNKFKLHAGWAQTVLFCSDLKIKELN